MEFHKVIEPAKELVQCLGEWVLNKIVPPESVELIQQESLKRTAPQLPFEDFEE